METFEKNDSAELRKRVSEQQSGAYAEALVRLMERSGDNTELVNALRDFVKEIDIKSWRGESDKPISEGYIERLTEFFRQKAEELKQLV